MVKIKICGITCEKDVEYLNIYKPDYAGFVMFFEKSKRNIDQNTARRLLSLLDKSIKTVAVVVSPNTEQIRVIESLGFDAVQIHGELSDSVINEVRIPILRAFNVTDINNFEKYSNCSKIIGYVFDSLAPGSGKSFDWSLLKAIPFDGKLRILAGGLTPENVGKAVRLVQPDGVDVSSGVENETGIGKSGEKIKAFTDSVRTEKK